MRTHGPSVRALWATLALVGALGVQAPAGAQAAAGDPLYVYVDAAGGLHITDRLLAVPEPYQAIYRREAKERAQPPPRRPAPEDVPPMAVDQLAGSTERPTTASTAADRKGWQNEVRRWQAQLKAATAALKLAEERLQAASNPILRLTPAGARALVAAEKAHADAREAALQARSMLLEVLPRRAREAHVPPQWLLP